MSKMSKNLGIILGGSMGIATSWMFSAPKSPIKLKLPETEVKNVEILPNLKIRRRNHVYHVHHWVYRGFSTLHLLSLENRLPEKGLFTVLCLD